MPKEYQLQFRQIDFAFCYGCRCLGVINQHAFFFTILDLQMSDLQLIDRNGNRHVDSG